jgi:hypothetical protein
LRVDPIAEDQGVMGDIFDDARGNPANAIAAILAGRRLRVPSETDIDHDLCRLSRICWSEIPNS